MFDFKYKKMIVDTRMADGNVHFEENLLRFLPRYPGQGNEIEIYYTDIKEVRCVHRLMKSEVTVITENDRITFYMYKVLTFVHILYCAILEVQRGIDFNNYNQGDENAFDFLLEQKIKNQISNADFEHRLSKIFNK